MDFSNFCKKTANLSLDLHVKAISELETYRSELGNNLKYISTD